MTTVTIKLVDFVKKEFKQISELEDTVESLSKSMPNTRAITLMRKHIADRRRGMQELLYKMYKIINKEYPDIKFDTSYEMFNLFEINLEIKKRDIPNINFKEDF